MLLVAAVEPCLHELVLTDILGAEFPEYTVEEHVSVRLVSLCHSLRRCSVDRPVGESQPFRDGKVEDDDWGLASLESVHHFNSDLEQAITEIFHMLLSGTFP